jgi:CRP-like cAMP-binding protein
MQRQPRKNLILAALPESVFQTWAPFFEFVDLPLGQVICEQGGTLSHIYFPLSSIVSWVHLLENGASTEVSMTGREGLVGLYQIMGARQASNRALVQTGGEAIRLRLDAVLASFQQDMRVQQIILGFAQALITQMAQTSVCRQHHSLEEQLCRMLLLTLDRQDSPTILLTQELIANLLGVRREGVTLAASRLMKDGVMDYARGRITIHDRAALQARTCECYGVVRHAYDRLQPPPA